MDEMPKKSTLTWVRSVDVVQPDARGLRIIAAGIFFVQTLGDAVEGGCVRCVGRGGGSVNQLNPGAGASVAHGDECLYVVVDDLRLVGVEH